MLKDKVCVVTGSARGIGKAIALQFAKNGAKVIVNDLKDSETVQMTMKELKELGCECVFCAGDVTKSDDAKALIETAITEFGKIDVLVNNAGITRDTLMLRMSEEDWDMVLSVNLKGAFNTTKAAAHSMMKQRCGSIINISSVVGLMGNPGQANYSASKAGLIGLTKSTAKEFAKKGVRCNAVAPGFIRSDMTDKLTDDVKQKYFDSIPLAKFGEPEDVAKLCTFLASDLSGYITGQVISVDGGLAM